ncbi:MAG: coiled-coil domain-containing protein, partial [Planctomycetota bacterium]
KRLAHSKEVRSALASELAVLTDMESRREGLNNAVKSILASSSAESGEFDYVESVLADIIVADVEYATAIEAALEGKTDTLVAGDTGQLIADNEKIQKLDGRVSFICTDKVEPFVDKMDFSGFRGVKGRAVEFIKYDSKYASLAWKLLGKTIVVDSVKTGVELAEKSGSDYKFVTLNGELVCSDGAIKLGPIGKRAGLISRKSRLHQLQDTISNISAEIEEIEKQIEKKNQTKGHIDKLCKELRTAIYEANTEEMQMASKLAVFEQNIKRLTAEQPLIASEIDLLEAQIAQSVKKEYNSKQKLQELDAVNNQRSARIEELEQNLDRQKVRQQSESERLTELKIALGQTAEKSKALKQTSAGLQKRLQENQSAGKAAKEETRTCKKQAEEAGMDILRCEAEVSELFVEKEKSQQSSHSLHHRIDELLSKQKQTEQLVRQKRAEQSEVDQKINQLRIELSQLEVKQQGLVERVQEELQIDLSNAYENYEDENVDWEAVREEITKLRGKVERLGNVNLDAIGEQEKLEERNEFLTSQVEDLNKSHAQLQQLIARLNKQSREKFRETFEEIRMHFQQIFRKLFGGGKADILLEDSQDVLEAGIEIMARPPGKETRSISLLSGGEKTMTAIALLFSVFKAKPSPFCLLDEVDAALDEANNERFNLLLREFLKDSQFIIITHAKRTMSIADMLYGITMQTRGVSKKISVRFDNIEEPQEVGAVA